MKNLRRHIEERHVDSLEIKKINTSGLSIAVCIFNFLHYYIKKKIIWVVDELKAKFL